LHTYPEIARAVNKLAREKWGQGATGPGSGGVWAPAKEDSLLDSGESVAGFLRRYAMGFVLWPNPGDKSPGYLPVSLRDTLRPRTTT